MNRVFANSVTFLLCCRLLLPSAVADDERLAYCRELWETRADSITSVSVAFAGTATSARGSRVQPGDPDAEGLIEVPKGGLPESDVTLPMRKQWLFDFAANRFTGVEEGHSFFVDFARFVPRVVHHRYDGVILASHHPRELNRDESYERLPGSTDIHYWRHDELHPWITTQIDYPVFLSLGLYRINVPLRESVRTVSAHFG